MFLHSPESREKKITGSSRARPHIHSSFHIYPPFGASTVSRPHFKTPAQLLLPTLPTTLSDLPIMLANNLPSTNFESENFSPFSTTSACSSSATSSFAKPPPAPAMDPRDAIRRLAGTNGLISVSDLRAIQRLGSGDIGSVYLAEIKICGGGRRVLVAAKVMDKCELVGRNKSSRAKTEREILEMLDHPFLPKLYGCAENEKLTCLLTEFCSGGDLHLLRQRQPAKSFNEHAVRFYAAELVVALEYLHVLGVIYRDLKPENVLVRSDGHIMLTDFDLSLKSDYGCSPTAKFVHGPRPSSHSSPSTRTPSKNGACIFSTCVSCLHRKGACRKKQESLPDGLDFVAEPVDLRSMSFVGTHEYLAPEIVSGEGHGSAVDWWTLGVFMYELLYATTPFKGLDEERTLGNILARGLEFPKDTAVSGTARELIAGLLVKDPAKRLGSTTGAAALKRHPFFNGVNWALLRCSVPPYVPAPFSVDGASDNGDEEDSSGEAVVEYY